MWHSDPFGDRTYYKLENIFRSFLRFAYFRTAIDRLHYITFVRVSMAKDMQDQIHIGDINLILVPERIPIVCSV